MTDLASRIEAGDRPYPDLLSDEEQKALRERAEQLWADLQANNLGGFSGINRPFWIMAEFKRVIEEFGRRDVGLHWSKDDLDAAVGTAIQDEIDSELSELPAELSVKISRTVQETHLVQLNGKDVIALLNAAPRGLYPGLEEVPDNASVVFQVPSGGDYSGEAVDFDREPRLKVCWTSKKEVS